VDLPRYRRIAAELEQAIATGDYPPGARLPSERELAERYGVARGTIRQALTALRHSGAIASRQGARGVALAAPRTQNFSELVSFSRWAQLQGATASGRVVSFERAAAAELDADRLAVPLGSAVWRLVRVRLLSGVPVLVERTTFPNEIGARVAAIDLETDSIYERLAAQGLVFAHAQHTIEAVAATAEDARLLGTRLGAALLRELRRTTSFDGRALEWSDDRYRGDAVRFAIENAAPAGTFGRLLSSESAR